MLAIQAAVTFLRPGQQMDTVVRLDRQMTVMFGIRQQNEDKEIVSLKNVMGVPREGALQTTSEISTLAKTTLFSANANASTMTKFKS